MAVLQQAAELAAAATPALDSDHTEEDAGRRRAAKRHTKRCWFFPRGTCAKGAACSFAHEDAELVEQTMPAKSDSACRHWSKGWCRAGDACRFAHPPADLKEHAESNDGDEPVTLDLRTLASFAEAAVDSYSHHETEIDTPATLEPQTLATLNDLTVDKVDVELSGEYVKFVTPLSCEPATIDDTELSRCLFGDERLRAHTVSSTAEPQWLPRL
eukprot:TRINITY_DN115146_c0_g1_i1.p1 TRINITY_DN115146_c0_g1~~TRINITY_DN115146_c0_g1_i1.p1  ORF type:complete len:214 (+),score=42.70 TRINITY_DN115146_c0_g1_i1:103-744(+)